MRRSTLGRALAWTCAIGILLTVTQLYLRPDFMITLADQLWSCF